MEAQLKKDYVASGLNSSLQILYGGYHELVNVTKYIYKFLK